MDGLAAQLSAKVDGKPWPIRAGLLEDEAATLRAWARQQGWNLDDDLPLGLEHYGHELIVVWPAEAWPPNGAVELTIAKGLRSTAGPLPSDHPMRYVTRGSPIPAPIPLAAVRHQDFFPAHCELLPEKTLIFLRYVSAGEARFTFFARAQVPGRYVLPGARVEAMYLPEIEGRGGASRFTVQSPK